MSVAELLQEARAAGVRIVRHGDAWKMEAAAAPPIKLRDALVANRPAIAAYLDAYPTPWDAADWHTYYEDRLRRSLDDGFDRQAAETHAYLCCESEWLNRHPVSSPEGLCDQCGRMERPGGRLMRYGGDASAVWLHPTCWEPWYRRRRQEAKAGLEVAGIKPPW